MGFMGNMGLILKVVIKREQMKTCFQYAEREQLHREAVIFNFQFSIFNLQSDDFHDVVLSGVGFSDEGVGFGDERFGFLTVVER